MSVARQCDCISPAEKQRLLKAAGGSMGAGASVASASAATRSEGKQGVESVRAPAQGDVLHCQLHMHALVYTPRPGRVCNLCSQKYGLFCECLRSLFSFVLPLE